MNLQEKLVTQTIAPKEAYVADTACWGCVHFGGLSCPGFRIFAKEFFEEAYDAYGVLLPRIVPCLEFILDSPYTFGHKKEEEQFVE